MSKILQRKCIRRVDVVCPPDKARGRNLRVQPAFLKVEAEKLGLQVSQIPSTESFRLQHWVPSKPADNDGGYDIGVVASFGYWISQPVIQAFPSGIINVHPSLLPKYRGSAPLQHAILNGDSETGVSIMRIMADRLDSGAVLRQNTYALSPSATFQTLLHDLSAMGGEMISDVLEDWERVQELPQNDAQTTRAPKLPTSAGLIDWSQTSEQIHRRWRALFGFASTYTTFRGKRCLLLELDNPLTPTPSSVLRAWSSSSAAAGTLSYDSSSRCLWVRCGGDGLGLPVKRLQLATKTATDATSFANGYLKPKPARGSAAEGGGAGAEAVVLGGPEQT